nr:pirin family protein [Chromobacterium sp. ASV5]
MPSRSLERIVRGREVSDGAGVRLLRVLTSDLQRRLDPFLMLDEFRSDNPDDYIAGFPSHPHRGFETVTYMLAGRMRHRDNAGHEGLLESGGMQWMTAGRGVIHSELPEQEDGLMHGFQLWINLPAAQKMQTPDYRDIQADGIPSLTSAQGNTLKLLSGEFAGQRGAILRPDTEPLYLDARLAAGSVESMAIPADHNAFVYVYQGTIAIGDEEREVGARQLAILANDGDSLRLAAREDSGALLLAARPLGEPIEQWGPFVMNTRQEIQQAIEDYKQGRF